MKGAEDLSAMWRTGSDWSGAASLPRGWQCRQPAGIRFRECARSAM